MVKGTVHRRHSNKCAEPCSSPILQINCSTPRGGGDLFPAAAGIGARRTSELPRLWAGIVMLGILGFVFNAFPLLERRVLAWHTGARRLVT
ncbi:hypothetical protein OHR68_10730 [Spirillospora sp. NBC_00431]